MDRFRPIPYPLTEPLWVPMPADDLTFGECVSEYAPQLLGVIGQANRDRAQVSALSGEVIE